MELLILARQKMGKYLFSISMREMQVRLLEGRANLSMEKASDQSRFQLYGSRRANRKRQPFRSRAQGLFGYGFGQALWRQKIK
jgi:hypothetical protein